MSPPRGFEVCLRDDVIRCGAGVLIGGSPLRAIRLSPRASAMLEGNRLRVVDAASGQLARRLLVANVADPVLNAAGVDPGELTAVIPVRDRCVQLDRALSTLGPLVRVVVVDDGSRDPAAVAAVAARHGADVVRLDANQGPAGARNAGLAAVRTPYVAFVDSDVTVTAGVLLDLARHLADPQVALVGPRVVGIARSARPRWFERYDEVASSLTLGTRACSVAPRAAVGWLPSACLVGRVEALGAGFDHSMRMGEDVDLVWRLVADGLSVRYDPSCVAAHDVRGTVRGWLGRKFLYGTGGADLALRHGDRVAPAVLPPTMAVAAWALLSRRWWSLPVAAAGVGMSVRRLDATLPGGHGRAAVAVRLGVRGLGWALRQESDLVLRHWWPATAAACLVSARARRVLLSALAVDAVSRGRAGLRPDPVTGWLGRRLDDLAYGGGLWVGALRGRSVRCLVPALSGGRRPAAPRDS
ncbi:mycofactocin biosynthesis glycosyltransferase MftF [Nocardioides pacificus]